MHIGRRVYLTLKNNFWTKNCSTFCKTMVSSELKSYEQAVAALNTLQTNSDVLDKQRKEIPRGCPSNSLPNVLNFLQRAEMNVDDLDKLHIIHVSGTKGKGSVCAFCESILRSSGFKTGFYSSPHLVEVRERIRINGQPLSKESFTENLFTVYNHLMATKDEFDGDMPAYFRFLTIMAFHVFLQEKVDVAIVEVGLGGAFDCTNIIKTPVVVGITSLGMDHVRVLGDTIEKIAWQKAGICKPMRPAFTVQQPENGMNVIMQRAKELKTTIHCVPPIDDYDFGGKPMKLGLAGKHQRTNASLAMHLCKTWLEETHPELIKFKYIGEGQPVVKKIIEGGDTATKCGMPLTDPFVVPDYFIQGLQDCYWAGRNQTFKREGVTYYLDGAHTPRSIQACINWFMEATEMEAKNVDGPVARALIFNSTGDRKDRSLISPLMVCGFDAVAFCPNIVSEDISGNSADHANYNTTRTKQMARCTGNNNIYEALQMEIKPTLDPHPHHNGVLQNSLDITNTNGAKLSAGDCVSSDLEGPLCTTSEHIGQHCTELSKKSEQTVPTLKKNAVFSCITKTLKWVAGSNDSKLGGPLQDGPATLASLQNAARIQVLITGSLHLVGGAIKVLNPKLPTEMQTDDREG